MQTLWSRSSGCHCSISRRLFNSVAKISRVQVQSEAFCNQESLFRDDKKFHWMPPSHLSNSCLVPFWSDILPTNWALTPSGTNNCFLFLSIRTCSMLTTTGPLSCTRFAPLAFVAALTFSIIHQGSAKWEPLSECDQRLSFHSSSPSVWPTEAHRIL